MKHPAYLGIDIGSISLNLVLTGPDRSVLFADYRRAGGSPIRAVQDAIGGLRDALPADAVIAGVGVTGSGRRLIAAVVGGDIVKNEISTHARAAIHLHPEVRTIFEIGGQDSKATVVRDRVVVDFAMNLVCAAGTGSFLDSQAKRLELSIEELGRIAARSRQPAAIAGRCTVFAESDIIHKQQAGHRQEDILMGLCLAMARNFLANVCAGKDIRPPVLLQGGVSANPAMRRAFEEILGYPVIIPRHHMVMGAYGAALLAADAALAQTRFRGFDIGQRAIETRAFTCRDYPNRCEIVELLDSGAILARGGGRCRKWEGDCAPQPPGPVPFSLASGPQTL